MRCYIVRKHPKTRWGILKSFTIHKVYATRAEANAEAKKRNQKAYDYLFTVACVQLKEMK